jgi:hypothetical protein
VSNRQFTIHLSSTELGFLFSHVSLLPMMASAIHPAANTKPSYLGKTIGLEPVFWPPLYSKLSKGFPRKMKSKS